MALIKVTERLYEIEHPRHVDNFNSLLTVEPGSLNYWISKVR